MRWTKIFLSAGVIFFLLTNINSGFSYGEESDKPDLTVYDIYNDNGKLSIKIGNIGQGEVPPGKGKLYIWIDDQLVWTYGLSTLYDQSFRFPGGRTVVQPQGLSGQHTIRAEIDPTNVIDEANEEDNSMKKVIGLGGIDIIEASAKVANYMEEYRKLPPKVTIGGTTLNMAEYLYAAAKAIISINDGTFEDFNIQNIPYINPPANPYIFIDLDDSVYGQPLTKEEFIEFMSGVAFSLCSSDAPDKFEIKTAEIRYCETVHFAACLLRFYEFFGFLPQQQDILIICPKGLVPWDTPEGYEEYTSAVNSWYPRYEPDTMYSFRRYNWCCVGYYEMFKKAKEIIGIETDLYKAGESIYNYVRNHWKQDGWNYFIGPAPFKDQPCSALENLRLERSNSAFQSYKMVGLYRSLGLPAKESRLYLPGSGWVNIDVHFTFGRDPDSNKHNQQHEPPWDDLSLPSKEDDFISVIKNIMAIPETETTTFNSIFINPTDVKEYGAPFIVDSAAEGGFDSIIVTVKTARGHLYYDSILFPERKEEDVLTPLIEEAHSKGVKIFIGFTTLMDHFDHTCKWQLLQWQQMDVGKSLEVENYPNKLICPAVREYRDMLTQMLSEIITDYNIDGVVLNQLVWATNGGHPDCDPYRGEDNWQQNLLVEYAQALVDTIKSHDPNIEVILQCIDPHTRSYPGTITLSSDPTLYNSINGLDGILIAFSRVNWIKSIIYDDIPSIANTANVYIAATAIPVIFSFYLNDEWEYPAELYHGLSRYVKSLGIEGINFHSPVSADGEFGYAFTRSQYEKIKNIKFIVNNPPVLGPIGNKEVNEGEILEFTIKATDPDGDFLSYSASHLPRGASFDPATHTFSWRPDYTQAGTYPEIHFAVSDGKLTDSETITITVNDAPRAPVFGSDLGDKQIDEGKLLKFVVRATAPDGDRMVSLGVEGLPEGANFKFLKKAIVRPKPNIAAVFNWEPDYNQAGQYQVTFIAKNEQRLSTSETITIAVNDVNRPPVIDEVADQVMNEAEELRLVINASDPDGEPVHFLLGPKLPHFAEKSGYQDHAEIIFKPGYDDAGVYNITIGVEDQAGLTASTSFALTVNDVSRAPVFDSDLGNKQIDEGKLLRFVVTASDPDGGHMVGLRAEGLPEGAEFKSMMRIAVYPNPHIAAVFNWRPDYNQAGQYQVSFIAENKQGLSTSKTITITVNNVSRAPVFDSDLGNKQIDEGKLLRFVVTASDPDGGHMVGLRAEGLPEGAEFKSMMRIAVYPNPHIAAAFSWRPDYNQAGKYQVSFIAKNRQGQSSSQSITITVNDVAQNRSPEFEVTDKQVNEGENLQFKIVARDPDGDTPTMKAEGLPQGATFKEDEVQPILPEVRYYTFDWTPTHEQAGEYPIKFVATDGDSETSQSITITVNDVPRAPVFDSDLGNKQIDEGKLLRFVVTASDPDGGHMVGLRAEGLPEGAEFKSMMRIAVYPNPHIAAAFSWKPDYNQAGEYKVTFIAGRNPTSETITITVNDVNRPPVIEQIPDKIMNEAEELRIAIKAYDPDNEPVHFLLGPNIPHFAEKTGYEDHAEIVFKPGYDDAGVYENITVGVEDQAGLTDSTSFKLTVNNINRPKAPSNLSATAHPASGVISLSWQDNSNDEDGFIIEKSLDGVSFTDAGSTRTNVTNICVDSVTPDTTYYYRILAYKQVGTSVLKSEWSNVAKIIIPPLPKIPTNLSVIVATPPAVISFSWQDNSDNEDGFVIERSLDGVSFIASIPVPANTTTLVDYLIPNTTYYHRVAAYKRVGTSVLKSGWSNVVKVITLPLNQPPVLDLIGDKTIDEGELLRFEVSATDPDGDSLSYSASRLPQGASFEPATHIFSWRPDYVQADTYPGIHFKVSDGELTDSEEVAIQVNNVIVEPPTVSLSVEPTTLGVNEPFTVTVSGESPVGLASVWWFVEDKDNFSSCNIPGTVDGVSRNLAPAQDFGAGSGTTNYTYTRRVTINEAGKYKIKANARDILYPVPGEPHQASEGAGMAMVLVNVEDKDITKPTVSISITPGNPTNADRITFTATASDDHALGSVYININGKTVIGSYTSPVTYTGGPYKAGQTIKYFAGAYDKAGNYNSTGSKKVYINPASPKAPSDITVAGVSSTWITLTWRDNSDNEDGFKVEKSLDGSLFTHLTTVSFKCRSISDMNLNPNTKYYYRVYAYNAGGDSPYSNIASAKTLPMNQPPALHPIGVGNKTVDESQLLRFWVSGTDPDGDQLTYLASNLPQGASKLVKMLYLKKYRNEYFLWRGKDANNSYRVKYSYQVDEGNWSKLSRKRRIRISKVSKGLEPGVHLFSVKAIDKYGTESEPMSIKFSVKQPT